MTDSELMVNGEGAMALSGVSTELGRSKPIYIRTVQYRATRKRYAKL